MNVLFRKNYTYFYLAISAIVIFMSREVIAMDGYKEICREQTITLLNASKDDANGIQDDSFRTALTSVLSFYEQEFTSKNFIEAPFKNEAGEKGDHYWLFHGVAIEGLKYFIKMHLHAISREYGKINVDNQPSALGEFFVKLGAIDHTLTSNSLNVNLIKIAVKQINEILIAKSTTRKKFDDFKRKFKQKSAPKPTDTHEDIKNLIGMLSLDEGSNGNLCIEISKNAQLNLLLNIREKGKACVGTRVLDADGNVIKSTLFNIDPSQNDNNQSKHDNNARVNGVRLLLPLADGVTVNAVKVEETDEELEKLLSGFLSDHNGDGEKKEELNYVKKSDSSRFKTYIKYALGGVMFLVCLYCNLQ